MSKILRFLRVLPMALLAFMLLACLCNNRRLPFVMLGVEYLVFESISFC